MFVRNFLQAGDYVIIVPFGLPVTLQYGEKGNIQKVYYGYENREDPLDESALYALIKSDMIPNTIQIKGGTTWVEGVLTLSNLQDIICEFDLVGSVPSCMRSNLESLLSSDSYLFSFYAGSVDSLASVFRGAVNNRRWLASAHFELLPGYAVPADINESKFESMVNNDRFEFTWPLIQSYMIYRNGKTLHHDLGMSIQSVNKISDYVDQQGYIKSTLELNDHTLSVSCTDVFKYDIFKSTVLVLDSDRKIIYSMNTSKKKRDSEVFCSMCGSRIHLSKNLKYVRCSDEHCVSRLYPRISQFLKTLSLPAVDFETYKDIVQNRSNMSVVDILDTSTYEAVKLECSLVEVIRSIVPLDILPRYQDIETLCRACDNSEGTLIYYITHVDKMISDLSLDKHVYSRLFKWLESVENVSDVMQVMNSDHISISKEMKRFDGPPIFRNKTIYITGTFRRGSHQDIKEILSSYSANVVEKFDKSTGCVLVGDIPENVNGNTINRAKSNRIPVMLESDFFNQYDIDSDLRENLK